MPLIAGPTYLLGSSTLEAYWARSAFATKAFRYFSANRIIAGGQAELFKAPVLRAGRECTAQYYRFP